MSDQPIAGMGMLDLVDEVNRLRAERDDHRERGNQNFSTAMIWRAQRDRLADGIRELVDDYTPPAHWSSGEQMAVPTDRLRALLDVAGGWTVSSDHRHLVEQLRRNRERGSALRGMEAELLLDEVERLCAERDRLVDGIQNIRDVYHATHNGPPPGSEQSVRSLRDEACVQAWSLLDVAGDDRGPLYRCPHCHRVAPWTDGMSTDLGDDRNEFWCQTCGAEVPLAACPRIVAGDDRKDGQ